MRHISKRRFSKLASIIKEVIQWAKDVGGYWGNSHFHEDVGYNILRRLKIDTADVFNALHSGHKRPVLELARGFIRAETPTRKYVNLLQILLIIAIILTIK